MIDIHDGVRSRGMEFDGAFLADDLGYRVSPLISPALHRSLVMPYHPELCAHVAGRGLDVRKLSGTKEEVEEEILSTLPVAMEGGRGLTASSDM
jgi:hypothetical protein